MTKEPGSVAVPGPAHDRDPMPTSVALGPEAEVRAWLEAHTRRSDEEYRKLRWRAQQSHRAVSGWWGVQTEDAWIAKCQAAVGDRDSGAFLLEQLGAERLLDADQMAAVWALRQSLLVELPTPTAGEVALIDLAVLAYANAIRVQGWIGNWSLHTEAEAFGQDGLRARFRDRYGTGSDRIDGVAVEDHVGRIAQMLLPLADRFSHQFRDCMARLDRMRQAPRPGAERLEPVRIRIRQDEPRGE